MRYLFFILFTLLSVTVYSQMCNTAPTSMGAITPTTSWTNVAANSGAKRYWTFTATAGCTYDFSSCNGANTNDTYLRLYSGTSPLTAVLQTSNDDNGPFCLSTKASLTWNCTTSGAYSILLTDYSCANLSQNTTLSHRVTCTPPYNPCTTIPVITCGTPISISVASGNGIYNPPTTSCGFSTPGKEYIFSFTPSQSGNYTISQPTSSGYIDWFYKTASGGCNGTGWTCIDDISNGNIGNANVNINLTAGVTYYFMADPETTGGGSLTFQLNCPILPPSNDTCGAAISINSIPYTSPVTTNNASSDDVPTSASGCGTQGSNLWYSLTGNGDILKASTCNASTNFDTEVRVYTGTCGSLNSMVEVTCNDDDATCSSSSLQSSVTWCTQIGVKYYISVGYYSAGAGYGNFVLSVTSQGACVSLPITLLSFDGHYDGTRVNLEWSTATENNNDYFYIERSTDGINWNKIIQKDAVGNSTQKVNYNDYDNYPSEGHNYYKLTQVDMDGKKETFDIIVVDVKIDVSKCEGPYYDINGKEVDISNCSPGIYLKKCGLIYKKVRIY